VNQYAKQYLDLSRWHVSEAIGLEAIGATEDAEQHRADAQEMYHNATGERRKRMTLDELSAAIEMARDEPPRLPVPHRQSA